MEARKLQVLAVAGVAAGCVVWLAGPALSVEPYVPEPVDFELRGGALTAVNDSRPRAAASRSATTFQSRAITAPKRFNLLGVRWRGTRDAALSVRIRRNGNRWSSWVGVPVESDDGPDPGSVEASKSRTTSAPLWAGDADQVQYRVSTAGAPRDVRLHFVNTKGTATRLDRLRTSLRRVTRSAITTFASLLGADADADVSQPEIVAREQWGADACQPRAAPRYGEVKLAFVHHTVTATDYGPEDSAAIVLGICRYHRNSNRWDDIGYQFLVDRYGKIFEGRAGGIDQAVIGAQAQGYNTQSTGIANLGTFSTTGQTEAGLAAIARLISWKLAIHGVPPTGKVAVRSAGGPTNRYPAGAQVMLDRISGHRDGNSTSCPGDGLYSQLPRLRGMVTGDPRTPTTLALQALTRRIPYGRKARLSGKLGVAGGAPVAGQGVSIRTLGSIGTSRTLAKAATGPAGTFAINLRLSFNRTLQASFPGAPGLRPAQSLPLVVGVRPRLTASFGAATPGRAKAGQRVLVHGSVRPRKRRAVLLVDREGSDGTFRRVAKLPVLARGGRIRASHRFRRAGRYRVRLGVDADARNFGARSAALTIVVSQ